MNTAACEQSQTAFFYVLTAAQRQKGIYDEQLLNTRNEPVIIGVDHGYDNIKTAHCYFKTGVACYDKGPTVQEQSSHLWR